jgi:hypothetical protein
LNKFLKDQSKNISNNKAKSILSLVDKDSKQDISIQTRNSLIPMLVKQLRLIMENLDQINQKLKQVVDKSEYKLTTCLVLVTNLLPCLSLILEILTDLILLIN